MILEYEYNRIRYDRKTQYSTVPATYERRGRREK